MTTTKSNALRALAYALIAVASFYIGDGYNRAAYQREYEKATCNFTGGFYVVAKNGRFCIPVQSPPVSQRHVRYLYL